MSQEPPKYDRLAPLLARLYWMFLGNALLVFLAYGLLNQRPPQLTRLDLAYWLATAGLVLVRYADIRWWNGKTADYQPATLKTWRRYATVVVAGALIIWLALRAHCLLAGWA